MTGCTAQLRPTSPSKRESSTHAGGSELLLFTCDVCMGAALGYIALYMYHYILSRPFFVPALSPVEWRQVILVSIIAALSIREGDLPSEQGRETVNIQATLLGGLGRATCAGVFLLATGLVTGALHDLARCWLMIWACLFLAWMCLSRLLLLGYRRHAARIKRRRESVVLIGARASLTRLASLLAADACITTIIDHSAIAGHVLATALANVASLAREGAIGLVVLALEDNEPGDAVEHILDSLKAAPVRVALCGSTPDTVFGSAEYLSIAGVPMCLVADRPLSKRDMFLKMLVDKLGAFLLLVLALPLLAAIALAILSETGGPILFQQRRTGWCGQLFTVYKFRTMRHVPGQHVLHQTQRGDPRCTGVGAFLRRTSLDELPQLWNVLLGDMSLVGPRPHADFMHARERADFGPAADYAQRQRVKPGLTGWAQVHGLRGAADTPEKLRQRVEFDRYYIDNWSLWLDLRILARTPWAVLRQENAF